MARRPKFRRRRFGWLRWMMRLATVLWVIWLAGFVVFTVAARLAMPPNPMPRADGIVVLTGGDGRVGTALALLREKDAPALLISGAGRGTYLGDFTADDAAAATLYAERISIGHLAATTQGNALETAEWARGRHMHSLLIVTADYHMWRAILLIKARLPDVVLYQVPVRPPAMEHLLSVGTMKLLAAEYTKYVVVRTGLDGLAEDQEGITP